MKRARGTGKAAASRKPAPASAQRVAKPPNSNLGLGGPLDFAHDLGRMVIGQLLFQTGFDRLQLRTADVLADVLFRYLELLGGAAKGYAGHAGRTDANLEDVVEVLGDLGVAADDLREFCRLWVVAKAEEGEEDEKKDMDDAMDGTADDNGGVGGPGDVGGVGGRPSADAASGPRPPDGMVVPTPLGVAGQFLRLPPGPFPISGCLRRVFQVCGDGMDGRGRGGMEV